MLHVAQKQTFDYLFKMCKMAYTLCVTCVYVYQIIKIMLVYSFRMNKCAK